MSVMGVVSLQSSADGVSGVASESGVPIGGQSNKHEENSLVSSLPLSKSQDSLGTQGSSVYSQHAVNVELSTSGEKKTQNRSAVGSVFQSSINFFVLRHSLLIIWIFNGSCPFCRFQFLLMERFQRILFKMPEMRFF